MKILPATGFIFCLGLILTFSSCQRSQSVHAGAEETTGNGYQPRTAPDLGVSIDRDRAGQIRGEVLSVDMARRSILIRVENGMQQTVQWNNDTTVNGVPVDSKPATTTRTPDGIMQALAFRPGSAVVIASTDDNGQKMATVIQVTDPSTKVKRLKKVKNRSRNS